MAYTKEVKPTTSNSPVAKPTTTNSPVIKPATSNTPIAKPTATHSIEAEPAVVYGKEADATASYSGVAKPASTQSLEGKAVDTFVAHMFPSILCEDGSYMLQENGDRINLEWYHTKDAKPAVADTSSVKPATVWTA